MKKNRIKLMLICLVIPIVSMNPIVIHASEEVPANQGVSVETRSTASYYYWRQVNNSYAGNQGVGGWINQGQPIYITQNGGTNSKTITYSQASIGVNISVAGRIFAGGASYTPGGNKTIVSTYGSGALSRGTYQPQYQKRVNVYNIKQGYYYYEFGRDTLQYYKTGQLKIPGEATWRWLPK